MITTNRFAAILGEVIPLALPTPPSISNGEFSVFGNDGVGMSGRMVSASAAVGTMNLAPCTSMQWRTYPKTQGARGLASR
jgi:hypothetical protein